MTQDANSTTSMQLDGKRNGSRQHTRLLGRNLIVDMWEYALKAKMTQRNCHWCIIAFLFQSYLIKAQKHSLPTSILPIFFMTYFHARALPLPTRNCIPNSHNTLALDPKMSKTLFFGGLKCGQFIHACHIWHGTISVFLVCFPSSHRRSNLTFSL